MSIRVVLADDHRIMREGLRDLLAKEPDLEVIGEAENGREAVRLAGNLKPDVVLMDIAMPDMSGLEATRKITAGVPGVKVLILSMYPERRFVAGALHAGASGYLLKDCAFQELAVGVRTVAAQHTYLSGRVADLITHGWMQQSEETRSSAHMVLTPREVEVLQFIAAGATTKEIAFNLNVSVKTVETHRHQIMQKLNLHSIAELTKYAIRQNLTSLEG